MLRGKISFQNLKVLTRKELTFFLNTPQAYIVLTVFLLLWEFLFFRNVFLVGEASLRLLFGLLPWLFLILIPALTMGIIARERAEGTLELLLTFPVTELEVILSKFAATLIWVGFSLLVVIPLGVSLDRFGNLDWGVVAGQFGASLLLASVLISLGIFVSTLFKNQISSLLVAAAVGFILVIVGFEMITASLPLSLASVAENLSLLSHFNSMARGVIDLRDLWYFLSATVVFLSLAYLILLRDKYGQRKEIYRPYREGVVIFVGIVILTNVIGGWIPGRLDLTANRRYTLSETTRKVVGGLDDVVSLTLYASGQLPAQLQPRLREVKDILRDYRTLGKGNLQVRIKDPQASQGVEREAQSLGVQRVQFNVVREGEFQARQGYLGLVVSYGGKNEVIPFIEGTNDLEYQLTSLISKLVTKEKPTVAFLSGHGEKSIFGDYLTFAKELRKQFEVKTLTLGEKDEAIPEDTRVLVIAGPTSQVEEKTRLAIQDFLEGGGSALFLIDGVSVNPQLLSASVQKENFADFLSSTYGVEVNADVVYDLRANETVTFGGGPLNLVVPYPFWVRSVPAEKDLPVVSRIEGVVIPWASSLKVNEDKVSTSGFKVTQLLTTTRFGGAVSGTFDLAPDAKLPSQNLSPQLIAVILSKDIKGAQDNQQQEKRMRLIVMGDSDFLSEQFVRNSPENISFGLEAVSWLAQQPSLASLQLKHQLDRRLFFENDAQRSVVRWGNLGLAAGLPLLLGLYRLNQRRKLGEKRYT